MNPNFFPSTSRLHSLVVLRLLMLVYIAEQHKREKRNSQKKKVSLNKTLVIYVFIFMTVSQAKGAHSVNFSRSPTIIYAVE